jgi:hypothetical protein
MQKETFLHELDTRLPDLVQSTSVRRQSQPIMSCQTRCLLFARMPLKFEKLHIFDIQVVRTIMNNLLEYPNGDLQ